MASFKQSFIISAITRKSSARTWHPARWSKQAEPLKPLIHSSPGFPYPRRHLSNTLCHQHHTILSHRSDDVCHVTDHTCTCLCTHTQAYSCNRTHSLSSRPCMRPFCFYTHSLYIACATSPMAYEYACTYNPVLMSNVGSCVWHEMLHSRSSVLSCQNPYPIHSHLYTPIFTLVLTVSHASFHVHCAQLEARSDDTNDGWHLCRSFNLHPPIHVTAPIYGHCHITLCHIIHSCFNFNLHPLFTSRRQYCCCHLADMRSLSYCIVVHRICSFQCLVAEEGLDWALLVVFDVAYLVLPTPFYVVSFFYLHIWCGSCHATGVPIWMRSASPANIPLLTVFISGLSRHVLDIVLSS